jgi:hypothetical protein
MSLAIPMKAPAIHGELIKSKNRIWTALLIFVSIAPSLSILSVAPRALKIPTGVLTEP